LLFLFYFLSIYRAQKYQVSVTAKIFIFFFALNQSNINNNKIFLAPEQVPVIQAASLTRAIFFSDYVQASQPVLIRGALKNWPSKPSDWTNDFVRSLIGHKT